MKICLVRPTFGSRFQVTPPLSLGYLSSALKKNGYNDIFLIDGSLHLLSPSAAALKISSEINPDIVGIQVYTGAHNWAKDFIIEFRKINNHAKVILGGPHITALKEHAMDYIGGDYAVMGEGEKAIVEFAQFCEGKISNPSQVTGLFFRENGKWTHADTKFGFIEDANEVAFPDWELLQPQKYFEYMEGATMPLKGKRPAPILTSRGCPYLCTFCSSGLTNKRIMRYRTPQNIVEEIKLLNKKYGVNEIFFTDDNLTMNIKRAEEIFDLLIKENLNIHWRAPNGVRIDRLSPELVKKMSKSGGYYVGVGVETGNADMMKRIKKKVNLSIVKDVVKLLRKNKIKVSGFFMCGLVGETLSNVNESINFACSVPFDRIQVSNYIPYPGSEDFSNIFGEGKDPNYAANVLKFQQNEYVPKFQSMELNEIIAIQKKFIRKFYLRPQIIVPFFANIKFSQIRAIMRHPFIVRWFDKNNSWFERKEQQ